MISCQYTSADIFFVPCRASDLAVTQQQKEKETLMMTSMGAQFLAGAPVTHFVTFLVGAAVVGAGNYVNSNRRER